MKKKTFIVQLLDSKKPNRKSFTQVEDANFYSNDTDASLVFIPHEDTFDFQSAKVVMYNRGDESLVERDMQVTTEDGRKVASYELPEEIISHWGEWTAQPVFISGGEVYSGSIVPFSVFRYLMDNRPPTLRDVIKLDELYSQLVTVMDEIADKDVISAPEIILARGGEDTLGERLDKEHNEVTAQLAQTKRVKIGGGVKAEPEDLSERTLGLLTGTGDPINLLSVPQDYSVTPYKTTFVKKGKNLWDGTFLKGIIISNSRISEVEGGVSAVLSVEPNTQYYVSKSASDRFRAGTFSEFPKVGMVPNSQPIANDALTGAPITTGENDFYLVLYLSLENQFPEMVQVEKGLDRTEYESPDKVKIDFVDNSLSGRALLEDSVSASKLNFVEKGKNLWRGEYVEDVGIIGETQNAILQPVVGAVSIVEKIEPNETYTVSKKSGSSNRLKIATFDVLPRGLTTVSRLIEASTVVSEATFTSEPNEKYVAVQVSYDQNYKKPDDFMIEKSPVKTEYEPHDAITIKLSEKSFEGVKTTNYPEKKIHLTHSIESNYDSDMEYVQHGVHDIDFLYGFYEDMVELFPDYITKETLGHEATGMPINLYTFAPPKPRTSSGISSYPPTKIIITTGIHGMEKNAAVATALFFKDLCNNWKNDSVLEALRWNFEFLVVPSVNPWGWNSKQRKNSNGVDINRNFPVGFVEGTDPDAGAYSGTSPASEVETQIMMDLIEDNQDALAFIDHHNSSSYSVQKHTIWTSSPSEEVRKYLNGFLTYMGAQSRKLYDFLPENESVEALTSTVGGSLYTFADSIITDSILLETSEENPASSGQKIGTDSVGNLFISIIKNYQ